MASVASSGASPLSGYELLQTDSNADTEESWAYIDIPTGSGPSSIGFFPSPASGSMSSFAIVGSNGHIEPSPPALSPLYLDVDQQPAYPATTFGEQAASYSVTSTPSDAAVAAAAAAHHQFMAAAVTSAAATTAMTSTTPAVDGQFMTPQDWMFGEQAFGEPSQQQQLQQQQQQQQQQQPQYSVQQLTGLSNFNMSNFPSTLQTANLGTFGPGLAAGQLDISSSMLSDSNVAPWDPMGSAVRQDEMFIMEQFTPPPQQHQLSPSIVSLSPVHTGSPVSPVIKTEPGSLKVVTAIPSPIRKVRGTNVRVEKRKAPQPGQQQQMLLSSSVSSSDGASTGSSGSSPTSKFVIVTPTSISAHAGKPNPFECFEAMRPSQRGRKGPLANDTKENALQVRRLGACFCCHARKVKCDKERPCKNCKKIMVQVPQVVCWQFQDFMTVLFPDFIREHFKKEEMTKFLTENIESFTVDGGEKPCTVELFSGSRFTAVLTIRAKFFTAKTPDVLQHWHTNVVGGPAIDLQSRGSAPIGLETDGGAAQRDELRRRAREYVAAITAEPLYAEQLTDSVRHTGLPRRVLEIVQAYAARTDAPIVRRALTIYAMHYVMTRHLCLTRQTIAALQSTKLVPQNVPWVTPRVLARQVKSVMDELLTREMQLLFENFSKSLKPKSRKEWAPCLAAFLVLCLFMETIETAADGFVVAENEVALRNGNSDGSSSSRSSATPLPYRREFALRINRELENMPFKQFAYQFHQIYQTHSRDASAKSFNPLVDDSLLDNGDLDGPAVEMVFMLRQLLQEPSWSELDFLTMDPWVPNQEEHPYPRDVSLDYTGRLLSKFLLSFTDEKYIFDKA